MPSNLSGARGPNAFGSGPAAVEIQLAGIPNCDKCRAARRWLDERGVPYRFHDLRVDGLDRETLDRWSHALGSEALLNRRGRTWRQLEPGCRHDLDEQSIRALMAREPLLVRRPVLIMDGEAIVAGFDAQHWETLFG